MRRIVLLVCFITLACARDPRLSEVEQAISIGNQKFFSRPSLSTGSITQVAVASLPEKVSGELEFVVHRGGYFVVYAFAKNSQLEDAVRFRFESVGQDVHLTVVGLPETRQKNVSLEVPMGFKTDKTIRFQFEIHSDEEGPYMVVFSQSRQAVHFSGSKEAKDVIERNSKGELVTKALGKGKGLIFGVDYKRSDFTSAQLKKAEHVANHP